jgi:ATP adenylyltransferase
MTDDSLKLKGFDKLWAPWRMKYIEGIDTGDTGGCVFCALPAAGDDHAACIVHRGETCFAVLNAFPYNNGHLMVVPYRHTADFSDLTAATRLELMDTAELMMTIVKKTMRPDGFNVGMNLGRTAGAGIADHLHLHVVPRWNGDTNFMPVIGGVKVISESLQDTRDKLARAVKQHLDGLSASK